MERKIGELFSYQQLTEKEKRNLLIAELVRRKGIISRTEISKTTGINAVSVSNYVNNYIRKKIISEKGFDISTGGRKPELIEFNKQENCVAGLSVGRDEIRAVLADLGVNVARKTRIPNPAGGDIAAKVIGALEELIDRNSATRNSLKTIGIGIPDNDLVSMGEDIKAHFGVETFIGGHAFCSACAEKKFNPDADTENLLYMHSDAGRGIFVRGDIFFGAAGPSGEIQIPRLKISKEEEELSEELKYLMPWGESLSIVELVKKEVSRGVGTKIVELANGAVENITLDVVIEAAMQNDRLATDIIENVAINLGLRIAYLVNVLSPETVVIGGGIEKAKGLVIDPIKKMINKLAVAKKAAALKIVPATLGEDAISLGAATLAAREIFLKA